MFPYDFQVPPQKRVRYIVHTDCKNEADDQYTLAHILMTPKLDVKGIVAGHFDGATRFNPVFGPGETAKASYDEVLKVMNLMHLSGQCPVLMGAPVALANEMTPIDSEGARFIIEEAMKEDDRPLFIGIQGGITDLASAILMEPRICDRMTAIWIGGGDYPKGGFEFNLMQDVHAANVVFKSSMPLWQVPVSTYKQFSVSLAELQYKVKPHGKIGAYLFNQLVELNHKLSNLPIPWPHGEIWHMGDEGVLAALMEDMQFDLGFRVVPAPAVDPETMSYLPGSSDRMIRVYSSMNVRTVLEDFFCKLAINFPNPED